jgi:hypothetical protein
MFKRPLQFEHIEEHLLAGASARNGSIKKPFKTI